MSGRAISLVFLLFITHAANALEIKGVEIGNVYSDLQLHDKFPNAKFEVLGTSGYSSCTVITTFLGRKVDGDIRRDELNRIISITIIFPDSDRDEAINIFDQKFGPSIRPPKSWANCSVWKTTDIRPVDISVCDNVPPRNGTRIFFIQAAPTQLDPSDM